MTADTTHERKLILATEAFRAFGMSDGAGYAAIRNDTLPIDVIRVGGQWKVRAADVARIVDGPQDGAA